MASLEQLLKQREKYELKVYKDSRGKLTVGIGHLVTSQDKLKLGDEIDDKRAMDLFKKDTASALSAARAQTAKAGIRDNDFIVYLASVDFQLGTDWTSDFKKTWKMILNGKYADAAGEVQKSARYSQTPERVRDFRRRCWRCRRPRHSCGAIYIPAAGPLPSGGDGNETTGSSTILH